MATSAYGGSPFQSRESGRTAHHEGKRQAGVRRQRPLLPDSWPTLRRTSLLRGLLHLWTPRLRTTRLRLRPTWLWLRRGLLRRRAQHWLQFWHGPLLSLPFPAGGLHDHAPASCCPASPRPLGDLAGRSWQPPRKLGRSVSQYFLGCHGLMVQMVPSCLVQMRGNGQPEFRLIPDLFHSGHVQWQALVNSRRTLIVGFS